jgi:hypothetical protein
VAHEKVWEAVASAAIQAGSTFKQDTGDGYTLGTFTKDGSFDYETYRRIQEVGNKAKIKKVFADRSVIEKVADHAIDRLKSVNRILCHGTRNGAEQRWFKDRLPNAEVLGTEISDTASQFPMTLQWDFHELKDGWANNWDVIYSNSWDHCYSPLKLFRTWSLSLRPGGLMYLEHTPDHLKVDHLDLFGATRTALRNVVEEGSEGSMLFMEPLPYHRRTIMVFCRGDI